MTYRRISGSKAIAAILLAAFCAFGSFSFADAPKKLDSPIPARVNDPAKWQTFLEDLLNKKMNYGALAASSRMLTFFSDLKSKEAAYKTIIQLVDMGLPISTRSLFVTADIEPKKDYQFVNSYYFYKALINQEKGLQKWAENQFSKVDKENFSKFLFYQALQAYAAKDLAKTKDLLKRILSTKSEVLQLSFLKKVARTLARIYFEEKAYDKSLDIYRSFLLRLNPVNPFDWIETSWNLYYLKRFDEALGTLYNIESAAAGTRVSLEKYVIRALIYREYCDSFHVSRLLKSFERDFGRAIRQIKTGQNALKIPELRKIYFEDSSEYYQAGVELEGLLFESTMISSFSGDLQPIAGYLYRSQITMARAKFRRELESAAGEASRRLIMLAEHLRFLKFDVEKVKFDPSSVFEAQEEPDEAYVTQLNDVSFQIRWPQSGDYWRDERLKYKARIRNRCAK